MWIEDSSNYTDGMEKGFPTSLGLSVIFILNSLRISFEVPSLVLTWCNLCLRKLLKCLHSRLETQSVEGSLCVYPVPIFFPSTIVTQDTWTRWAIDLMCIVSPPSTRQHTHAWPHCVSWENQMQHLIWAAFRWNNHNSLGGYLPCKPNCFPVLEVWGGAENFVLS